MIYFLFAELTISDINEISLLVSILALLVSICGFTVICLQLQCASESVKSQGRDSLYSLSHNTYGLFLECPNLMKYFFEGESIPSNQELKDKVFVMAELLCDFFEHIYFSANTLDEELKKVWMRYIKSTYTNSPCLQDFILRKEVQYSPSFLKELRSSF